MVDAEVERVFREFWQEIVCPNGEWDLEQVKRELFDFHTVIQEVSKVYDDVTMGMFSKPDTRAEFVIDRVRELAQRDVDDALKEMAEEQNTNG